MTLKEKSNQTLKEKEKNEICGPYFRQGLFKKKDLFLHRYKKNCKLEILRSRIRLQPIKTFLKFCYDNPRGTGPG